MKQTRLSICMIKLKMRMCARNGSKYEHEFQQQFDSKSIHPPPNEEMRVS